MLENPKSYCPECAAEVEPAEVLDRRGFFRTVGERAAGLALLSSAAATPHLLADTAKPADKPAKPAEGLIQELHDSLSADQKQKLILPWNHGAVEGKALPLRLRMVNSPLNNLRVGTEYTKPQQELIERIVRAIASDEDGYQKISRNGKFDGSGSLQGCGALMFGELAAGKRFAFVFTGHHLTIRCPGTSEEGAAFGGPMYYGHSPNGYSDRNVFWYQTKSVLSVWDSLSEAQRKQAVASPSPGEGEQSVRFRRKDQPKPGVGYADLTKDQRQLVETVMRDVLSPFRKEDGDEVMKIVKMNGGMEQLHLAFYEDKAMNDNQRWHFWRLEGPGFVWNYRVLPHVHTFVSISSKV
jgi:hypothetical protein